MSKLFRSRKFSESQLSIPQDQFSLIAKVITDHFSRKSDSPLTPFLTSVLKKYEGQKNEDADRRAIEKFETTEDHCRTINHRFRCNSPLGQSEPILDRARTLIHQCLGFDFSMEELASSGRFGPGSSTECRGINATGERKFESAKCTPDSRVFMQMILQRYFPVWSLYLTDADNCSPLLETTAFGRLSCVFKNTEISRIIIIEPELNTYFQLALGRMIRKRVKRAFQLDLNTSDKVNRALAKLGSISDDLATIDFASASDCISIELCRWLLPPAWFDAMMIFRTPDISFPSGKKTRLEKISSMGNGYTWELESLIFHAIAIATCEVEGYNDFWVSTFGDDVVIPTGCAPEFITACETVGLMVNKEKSYLSGPFRESCGTDWWNGLDVRPVYFREPTYFSMINFINQLQRSSHGVYTSLGKKLIHLVKPEFRVWGVAHEGCLFSPSAGLDRDTRWKGDKAPTTWDGTWSRVLRPIPNDGKRKCNRFTLLYKTSTINSQDKEEYKLRSFSHYETDLVFVPAY